MLAAPLVFTLLEAAFIAPAPLPLVFTAAPLFDALALLFELEFKLAFGVDTLAPLAVPVAADPLACAAAFAPEFTFALAEFAALPVC